MTASIKRLNEQLIEARARIRELEAALRARGHTDLCATRVRGNFPCDCGLDAALTALETEAEALEHKFHCEFCDKGFLTPDAILYLTYPYGGA